MRYCERCILPDTRPGLKLGADGTCSACLSHGQDAPSVDWASRREQFERLVDEIRSLGRVYDCVIPVSGGKDSTWQVITCLEWGLRPLTVTWRTPGRTEVGERNLRNLVELGVDHVDFSISPEVERRFMLRTLERSGTPAIPMHLAIFNVPTTIAARYDVPLVVWGENSAMEYVGGDAAHTFYLTGDWVRKYGAVQGTVAEDWICEGLTARDLSAYHGPSDSELGAKGVRAVFLGMFFEWDPQETYRVAAEHGFEAASGPRTGTWDYADIDDDFISIHHWLKWYKFGFTRAWDNVSIEIRNGRMTRAEAIETVRALGDQCPRADIEAFCRYVRIDEGRFFAIAETFRNPDIGTHRDGAWKIDVFLIRDYTWT
ncbi:MAG: N-acetyl sugar amidotransferase [Solirubrobacteraceae bacterium]